MRSIVLALALTLALMPAAFAKDACHDAKGKFTKCPPSASAPAAHPKQCKKGKPCGNTCISVKDVCHK